MFKRKIIDDLLQWKEEEQGKCALLIEGARRVGKSTIVREFAKTYASSLIIDFSEKGNENIIDIFEHHSSDLDDFFFRLGLETKTSFVERNTLIVFDEVQNYPYARQMIKYLVEDGRYDYIETGSLISIRQNIRYIQIPSEERRLEMYPMTFEEFLWAEGKDVVADAIHSCFERKYLDSSINKSIIREFRKYMLIGGMPQVISKYLESNDINKVENVKKDIINLYRSDIEKIPGSYSSTALMLFDNIPNMLTAHSRIFAPGKITNGSRTRQYTNALVWLSEAKLINQCFKVYDPNVAYSLTTDPTRFKNYFLDTGLLISLAFGKNRESLDETYAALLNGKLNVNEGMFFENIIAQELVARGYDLRFSEFYHEDSKELQEVDFIIPGVKKIIPIESKSSKSTKHVSLDRFIDKFGDRVEKAYVLHPKEMRMEGKITYLPAYMAMCL